jgi:hypothetical protein
MSRQLDTALAAAISSGDITPFFMAQLSFKTQIQWVWTGVGNLVWSGQTFVGVGSVAKIGTIQEGSVVYAYGTTVTLSGIDPDLLGECLTDMEPGAQATLWFGVLSSAGTIIGSPYQVFSGSMDQPTVSVGVDTISITLALETKMLDLSRASNRRYTSADQRLYFPTDSAFGWVEPLNDMADVWGT